MKKLLVGLLAVLISTFAIAHTINWHVGDQIISTTTCNSGDSVTPPTAPAKRGHHLKEWAGYIKLEYIEGTGTQYINTGVVPTINTGVYIKTSFTTLNNSDNIIFGASNTNGFDGGKAFAYDPFPSFSYFAFGNFATTNNYKVNAPTTVNTVYEYELNYMNSGKAKTNTTETTIPTATEMTTYSIFLFGCSYIGRRGSDGTNGAKVYDFIISEGTNIIQHLVPSRRLSDSAIGMYDTVTDTFFTNQGTGEFIAGPEIGDL